MTRTVVVGSGMAATRLVEQLVARGVGDVTVLGDEPHAAYNRILLSAVLEGTHRPEAITLREPGWYAAHGVTLRRGARVLDLDLAAREVMLVDGERLGYDRLVLATGSVPSLPPIRGLVRMDGTLHPAVHPFRSLDDCRRLDEAVRGLVGAPFETPARPSRAPQGAGLELPLPEVRAERALRDGRSSFETVAERPPQEPSLATSSGTGGQGTESPLPEVRAERATKGAPRAVVVGGGLLGLQVARALAVRGLAVELVEGGEHLLNSQVGEKAGRIIARDLTRLGTAVYTGARVVRLGEQDGRPALRLDNGYTLDADLVVLTAGGRPSTALAKRAGLTVRRGVVVDGTLTTSDPAVHALGDCAEHDGRTTGFVAPAWEQAEVLAAHLAGEAAAYAGTRSVARLRATGLDVAVLGDPLHAEGDVVEMTNPVTRSHRRLVVRDGVVVAAELVGDLSRIGLVTQHYDRGTVLGPDEPGALLLPDRPTTGAAASAVSLPDDAEVCACAGVPAGAVRACASLEDVRDTTRATTGCGGCSPVVRQLLATRSPQPV